MAPTKVGADNPYPWFPTEWDPNTVTIASVTVDTGEIQRSGERAAVVSYLRRIQHGDDTDTHDVGTAGALADAIERGEHLK